MTCVCLVLEAATAAAIVYRSAMAGVVYIYVCSFCGAAHVVFCRCRRYRPLDEVLVRLVSHRPGTRPHHRRNTPVHASLPGYGATGTDGAPEAWHAVQGRQRVWDRAKGEGGEGGEGVASRDVGSLDGRGSVDADARGRASVTRGDPWSTGDLTGGGRRRNEEEGGGRRREYFRKEGGRRHEGRRNECEILV